MDIKVLFIGGHRDRHVDTLDSMNQRVEGYHFELVGMDLDKIDGCSGKFTLPVMVADDKNMDDALVELSNVMDLLGWFFTERKKAA